MKIKTEFTANNLTIFGGYSNIFSFFVKSNIFDNLDKFISVHKVKKIYEKLDHIKILLTMLTFGFKNMNQISLLSKDSYIHKILDVKRIPHASTLARFIKSFTFSHCQEIVELKRELFKKYHKKSFSLKKLTIDIDTSVVNLYGHQEGAEKGYNDIKRGNRCYHPILAFIYETKELLHGILKPGDTHCSNGAVEFIKEITSMLPSGLCDITIRADSGFFSQYLLDHLEKIHFNYIIAVKNYTTLMQRIMSIPENAFRPFEVTNSIAVFHYQLNSWSTKRKFVVVRTPQEVVNPQINLFGTVLYSYQIYVTNLNDDPKKLVHYYHKRGNAENYIKEQKYDMNMGKLITDSFWANQALFQFTILCYNLLVWFKTICIGKSELRTTIRTLRERYLMIPGQLVKRSRMFILKLSRNYMYKEKFKLIEMQVV